LSLDSFLLSAHRSTSGVAKLDGRADSRQAHVMHYSSRGDLGVEQ
jgi:hypothetical protein